MNKMNLEKKILDLKEEINSKLSPLITGDYVLTDVPYHQNIGDVLIYEGTRDFLSEKPYKCLDISSYETFQFPKLPPECTILMNGGGNFGDLYRGSQTFRLKVIQHYKNHKIIILPQSVYYKNKSLIYEDLKIFEEHKNLYLCARDDFSYRFMKKYFHRNQVLLVPDMAFYVNIGRFKRQKKDSTSDILCLKRRDKEFVTHSLRTHDFNEVFDWPSYEEFSLRILLLRGLLGVYRRLPLGFYGTSALARMIDVYFDQCVKNFLLQSGITFIDRYSSIITTRLHGMILATILGKQVFYVDNSTKKISAFVSTWLSDLENIKQFKEE